MWAHLLGSHVEEYLVMSSGSSKNEAHVVQYHLAGAHAGGTQQTLLKCAFSRSTTKSTSLASIGRASEIQVV